MRIGRNFTNLLEFSFLDKEHKEKFEKGEIDVPYMDALVQIKSKKDIINQINVAKEIGLDHIELDGGVPNPFLEISDEEIQKAKDHAEKMGITISIHLPYTYVAESTCAFQESDRKLAEQLQKQYLDFAHKLGCINAVMHPGSVPFYQATGKYRLDVDVALTKTLKALAVYAHERNINLHLENNTKFDIIHIDPIETLKILDKVEEETGVKVNYCFDIGHWYTKFTKTSQLPDPPESIVEEIPAKYLQGQVHLNDFIPEKCKFHPPLHYESGPLKKQNLIELAKIFKKKGVKLIIVETAVRERDELMNAHQLLLDETAYLNGIFKEVE